MSHPKLASLVNYISVAVLDVLVVILTVCRTYRLALQSSREASVSTNLSFILLRDGMLYYGAIFIPQLAVMVMNVVVLRTDSNILDDVTEALNFVVAVLEVVLVNRLMLNLIHTANTDEDSEFRTRTGLEPPTFATGPFLGSIGGPFSTRPDYSEDDILDVEGDESIDSDKFEGNALESTSANDTEDRYARAETGPSSTRVIEVERAQVF